MNSMQRFLPLAFAVCASSAFAASASPHWSYGHHGGPAEWSALSPEFATCRLGKHQSPIDIRGAKASDLPPIAFHYQQAPLAIIDNGHTIQVNVAPGSWIDVGGAHYDLIQFHFHKPSEEKIDGKAHAMVAHLVHKNADGKLAVVAVLLDGGGSNATIDSIWKNLPKEKQKEVVVANTTVDADALLPKGRGYYTFQGSLTTPPCSEDVTWLVLKDPVKIADGEISEFGHIYPMNARVAGQGGAAYNAYTGNAVAGGSRTTVNTNTGRVTDTAGIAGANASGAAAIGGFNTEGKGGDAKGAGYVKYDRNTGDVSHGGVASINDSIYAGKDGNVYKYDKATVGSKSGATANSTRRPNCLRPGTWIATATRANAARTAISTAAPATYPAET